MNSLNEDIKSICESVGVNLYDIETVFEGDDKIFRIFIVDIKNKISVDKCARVSRLLAPMLDVHPPVLGEYRLEVSSAGIERSLKIPEHYEMSVGEKIKIVTKDGEKFIAPLTEANKKEFVLKLDDKEIVFEYSAIKKARIYFEW